jgi:hypothetical protein
MISRSVLGPASGGGELPDPPGLRPEEQQPGEERRGVEPERDHDPLVAEAVELRLVHEQEPAREREERRGTEHALRDPLDVLAEDGHPFRISGHRRADHEELHHQRPSDPDHRERDVDEQQELVPRHVDPFPR